jgi:hypothetical protein
MVCTYLGSVTPNHDEPFYIILLKHPEGIPQTFRCLEFGTAGAAENGAAFLDDPTHIPRSQRRQIASDEARIPVANSYDLTTLRNSDPDCGSDRGIHAGSIPAAGKHCKTFHISSGFFFKRIQPMLINAISCLGPSASYDTSQIYR